MAMANTIKHSHSDLEPQTVVSWRIADEPRVPNLKWTLDGGLAAAGVGAAIASAAFALVMLQADIKTPTFGGAEYLELFTRPLKTLDNRQVAARPSNRDIDMMPTASIASGKTAPADAAIAEEDRLHTSVKDYKLQMVRGGVAIIDGPTGRFSVESGTLMPNGDHVLSIDRRSGRWVVVTTSGIIENQ